jgi:CO/xanthine dehydrogenase Mo-binding subunit
MIRSVTPALSQATLIDIMLLNHLGYPFLGSGEAAQGPTPAAIANAVYDALEMRLRKIPFTPERIRAALNEN